MSTRKRNVVGIILVLILLIVLATPFVSGWMFKKKYPELVRALSEDLQLTIEVVNYNQGWFTSDVVLKITVPSFPPTMSPTPFSNTTLVLNEKIIHGPIIWDSEFKNVKFGCALMRMNFTLMEEPKVVIEDESLMTFAGNLEGNFRILPVSFVFPFIGKLEWQGLAGSNKINLKNYHITSIKTDLKVKPLTFNGEAGKLQVSDILIETSGTYHPEYGLWDLKNTHSLASIDGAFKNAVFGLKDLEFDIVGGLSQNAYSLEIDTLVKQIVTPILTFNPSSIKISLKNLDAKALQSINKPAITPTEIKEFYLKVFTPKSLFDAKTSLKTNQGDLTLDWAFNWPANTPAFQNYESLLANIKFTINLNVSTSLVQFYLNLLPNDLPINPVDPNAPAQSLSQRQIITGNINELVQKGVLIIDKDRYVMNLLYQNGVLKINNTSWPLDPKTLIDEFEKAQQQRS